MFVSNRGFGLMSAALALVVLVGCSGENNQYSDDIYADDTTNGLGGGIYTGDTTNGLGGGIHTGDTAKGADETYTLTVVASPANGGGVSLDPNRAQYNAGTKVTATAAPNAGYEFTGWSGASTSQETSVTVTMDGDKALTANYRALVYRITAVASPADGGYVSLDPDKAQYDFGTKVKAAAAPNAGYEFMGWSGASTSQETSVTVTMDGDKALTANFARLYKVNVGSGVHSYPRGSNQMYPAGMQVTLKADPPPPGQVFVGWSGGLSSTDLTVTITVTKDTTINAIYSYIKYTLDLSITPDGGGTVSPASGTKYNYGHQMTVTATPNNGYEFAGWSGTSSSNLTSTTDPEVRFTATGDVWLTANFERVYTLTINNSSGGTVSYDPRQRTYRAGTLVTVTAEPNALHQFVRWEIVRWPSETPMPSLKNATITIPMNADIQLGAVFETCILICRSASGLGE
ncbi:hypothetical protein R80B4_00292 [Fibrobacteres bacterium R8-0-B4]